jgi:hypothetical protein
MGQTGGEDFKLYGGHRLWIAPEVESRTLQPDNEPIEYRVDEQEWHVFSASKDVWNVQKEIWIRSEGEGAFWIEHRVINHTPYTIDIAPWALTQFAPGGTAYFPMPEFKAHTEEVLPDRPLVLWGYSNLADPRWGWSRSLASFKHDAERGPQKVGSFVRQGYAAYANHGNLFIKTFSSDEEQTYPDFGCNFETFANELFLEVESLGPMVNLPPDGTIVHLEGWRLYSGVDLPADLEEAAPVIAELALEVPESGDLVI